VALKSDKNEPDTKGETANVAGMMWRAIVILSALMLLALGGFYTLANWDTGPTWFVSPPEKVLAADSLEVRGKKLRGAIDWEYSKVAKTDVFYNRDKGDADISSTILKYIPVGTSVSDGAAILKYAGLDVRDERKDRHMVSGYIPFFGGKIELVSLYIQLNVEERRKDTISNVWGALYSSVTNNIKE
jgi:hypothetical protein